MTGPPQMIAGVRLEPTGFDQLEGWAEDNHTEALRVFCKTFDSNNPDRFKTRKFGISAPELEKLAILAGVHAPMNGICAKKFFETHFQPCELVENNSLAEPHTGFVTAYFEPEVEASRVCSEMFNAPLYARPPDLVDLDDTNRPETLDAGFRFGRLAEYAASTKIEEYFDRAAIEAGCLSGKGLEIAWVRDKVEALYIHIQGSARLRFPDGSTTRVGYAAKSGHPYTAVGSVLIRSGELDSNNCGMKDIRSWFANNPEKAGSVINCNRSYIFFQEFPPESGGNGPIGAAKTDLTPYRSIAIDRLLHTFGTPIWIETTQPLPDSQECFNQLMIAQDTGSAIVGPGRGDLFLGSGQKAGSIAGNVRHNARFVVLKPKTAGL